jgi:hypothetical protein
VVEPNDPSVLVNGVERLHESWVAADGRQLPMRLNERGASLKAHGTARDVLPSKVLAGTPQA